MRYAIALAVLSLAAVAAAPVPESPQQQIARLEARVAALEARLAKLEGMPAATQPASRPAAVQPGAVTQQKTYTVDALFRAIPADLRSATDAGNRLLAERLQQWVNHELLGNKLRGAGYVLQTEPARADGKSFEMLIRIADKPNAPIGSDLRCTFPTALLDKAAKLKAGQRVKITGLMTRLTILDDKRINGALIDCELE